MEPIVIKIPKKETNPVKITEKLQEALKRGGLNGSVELRVSNRFVDLFSNYSEKTSALEAPKYREITTRYIDQATGDEYKTTFRKTFNEEYPTLERIILNKEVIYRRDREKEISDVCYILKCTEKKIHEKQPKR